MSEQLDNLEREVEAALASVSDKLSVVPSEAAVLRVKAAVRHEANEAWLSRQPVPTPASDTIERARVAVRDELQQRQGVMRSSGAWQRGWSAVAAAAMILLAVGVIHRAGTLTDPTPDATGDPELDLFLATAESVLAGDPVMSAILADLDVVEQRIMSWQSAGELDTDSLNDLVDELDDLLAEPDADGNMSRRRNEQRGAIG